MAKNDKRYDIRRLKDAVSIVDVVTSMGVPAKGTGDKMEFLCQSPEHKGSTGNGDTRFGSCKLRHGTNITCFACGKSWDSISLLTDWYGYSFKDACNYLAELSGNADFFETENTGKKRLYLTKQEKAFLGMGNGTAVYFPVNISDRQIDGLPPGYVCKKRTIFKLEPQEYVEEYVIFKRAEFNPAIDGHDELFTQIVLEKCREKIARFYAMIQEVKGPSYGPLAYIHVVNVRLSPSIRFTEKDMISAYMHHMDFGMKIYKRFGGKENNAEALAKKFINSHKEMPF